MADAEFSLKERDKVRYIKDRLARMVVKSGGGAILAAILLIFFYLVSMVLPIFSSPEVKYLASYPYKYANRIVGIGIGDYGENAFLFDQQGVLSYVGLNKQQASVLLSTQVANKPTAFASSPPSQGWFAYADSLGEVVAVKPSFDVSFSSEGRVLTPNLKVFNDKGSIIIDPKGEASIKLVFAIEHQEGTFVSLSESGRVSAVEVNDSKSNSITLPHMPDQIDELVLSPNGKQLFVLSGNELMIAQKDGLRFWVRELLDLSLGQQAKQVLGIALLSGAHSILVTHQDNTVSQWFDVLKDGERSLTKIRDFSLKASSQRLLTDTYGKGFYSFSANGELESFYTTSENVLLAEKIYQSLPQNSALSENESFLIALTKDGLTTHQIFNAHPEVSFSSLWQKVWYESYPEPQYVWQSTSASDDFEAKFSLIPITFGTLKATFFTMLVSIPIAVLGAIYTAYFMSSSMRKFVKPAVEIMEALPTVIIGFLAALWLAPLVETYLTGVIVLLLALPLSAIAMSAIWGVLPNNLVRQLPNGWHVVVLVPIIILVSYFSLNYSANIEALLFNGDIRLFLADHGISYDQRNALVVGLAMGFAVIPTIFTIAEDAIFSVPKHLSDGSLALGATQWQTLIYVVLLTASPGIFSAIMIGLGRAVGETMIVLMATGNTPIMDFNIFEGMRSLSATIAVEMPESEVGDTHYRILFLAALVLFIFTFAVNSLAEVVRQRLKERYSSL